MDSGNKEREIASRLITRGQARRRVVLLPDTAYFVGLKLMTASVKPTRDDVARVLCSSKCKAVCFACTGKANEIVRLYGHASSISAGPAD